MLHETKTTTHTSWVQERCRFRFKHIKTVYEFHGCFWHGCPYCSEPSPIVPPRSYTCMDKKTDKEKTIEVRMGNLYANAQLKMMKLLQSEYLVVEMWECEWKKLCKQTKINPSEIFRKHTWSPWYLMMPTLELESTAQKCCILVRMQTVFTTLM